MRRQRGFSLIELLIVVAIILVIAAIAIPNLLRARIAANESSAVASVRTINTAEVSYYTSYPTIGFSGSLTTLTGTCTGTTIPTSASACLIDTLLASGTKSGYSFTLSSYNPSPYSAYEIDAKPLVSNQSGVRYFCSNEDAVVRYGTSAAFTGNGNCTTSGTPLQ